MSLRAPRRSLHWAGPPRHDGHVLRRPWLHGDRGGLQGRSAGPDRASEPPADPPQNAVLNHKGTIDKYIGDGIMAFWNAPLPDDAHELNACAAALEMLDRLSALNAERAREGLASGQAAPPLRIGIGLNTGPCFVGQFRVRPALQLFGTRRHRQRFVRLESQCKTYGVPIVMGSGLPKRSNGTMPSLNSIPSRSLANGGGTHLHADQQSGLGFLSRLRRPFQANELMLTAYRQGDWDGLSRSFSRAANSPGCSRSTPIIPLWSAGSAR